MTAALARLGLADRAHDPIRITPNAAGTARVAQTFLPSRRAPRGPARDAGSTVPGARALASSEGVDALPPHWPSVTTPAMLLAWHLDVQGVPRATYFELLAPLAAEPRERARLRELGLPGGQVSLGIQRTGRASVHACPLRA